MSEVVNEAVRASVGRLVSLGRSEGLSDARIREIVVGSMKAAMLVYPTDPYRAETLMAVCSRALDARMRATQWGTDALVGHLPRTRAKSSFRFCFSNRELRS